MAGHVLFYILNPKRGEGISGGLRTGEFNQQLFLKQSSQ